MVGAQPLYWKLIYGEEAYYITAISNGKIVHRSTLFSRNPRHPFMGPWDMQFGGAFTSPKARRKGIFMAALVSAANKFIASKRYKIDQSRLILLVRSENQITNKIAKDLGFILKGQVVKSKFFLPAYNLSMDL